MEVGGSEITTLAMDHHGLIAATCKDLKIAERIDKLLYADDTGRNVTPGESVVAMIINGLGFTNRRLYLMPQFFANKPVDKLIAEGLTADDITYDTLAATLDDIWAYGESKLYGQVALDIALDNGLLGTLNHLDTTSVSVEGNYDVPDEPGVVKLTHGHSKDHRPDLKQLLVSLVVTGDSRFPLWMEALDGNSSDKVNFHETLTRVKVFQEQIKHRSTSKWVADSALYTKEKLAKTDDYVWLTRVPETLKDAQQLVTQSPDAIAWADRGNGYHTAAYTSQYGDVSQRWLLVQSEQGYKREMGTFEKRLAKQEEKCGIEADKLSRQLFGCEQDAIKALDKFAKSKRYFEISGDVNVVTKYAGKGRPKEGAEKIIKGYSIDVKVSRDNDAITKESYKKGRFILATNDLNESDYPDENMLSDYKSQQDVESGFRFLKDPWFMLDSIFLKRPNRISALMMVMTLCLMVYNVAEHRMRRKLADHEATLPNQKGKAISNPTLRWVFQLMEGITLVNLQGEGDLDTSRLIITNINNIRRKIIYLFGPSACEIYGLEINEEIAHPLRM